MGLFTNPVVLTDGVDVTRNFSFRAQISDPKSVVGEWIEDGPSIAEDSKLVVKHDSRSTTPRHLIQRKTNRHPSANTGDAILEPITINTTVVCSKAFTVAEVQTELNIHIDALQEANFLTGFLQGKI